MSKYSVNHHPVSTLLAQIQSESIAVPELQRPFVWNSVKVRDLLDSLYNGYPIGYLITWQSVGAHIKGGGTASHQQILIDGQQRITALRAAVAGLPVVDKHYKQTRITIAFNPVTEAFATRTPVIGRDPQWIPDVSKAFELSPYAFVTAYVKKNPQVDSEVVARNIDKLVNVKNAQIGVITLNDDLDVETVSEIFVRINSKGVSLSSADFAMSKIATWGAEGRNLRKLIDYFCHLAAAPSAFDDITENDEEFVSSGYLEKISWLKDESEDLYRPGYGDIIRVAGLVGFSRGKVSSIVSELSGRDPETRRMDPARVPLAFDRLEEALGEIVREYHFKNFLMIIQSAGFIVPKLIGSKNALNFAYGLYLRLRGNALMVEAERQRVVRRWFVMSTLTGRHSGGFESRWEQDMRRIDELGAAAYLRQLEEAELGETFWRVTLPADLQTTSTGSPYFNVFLASQVQANAKGFLSRSISVADMLRHSGDIHHLVPREYLKRAGLNKAVDYNQVANYVMTETAINIRIGDQDPGEYMRRVGYQCETGQPDLGEITDAKLLGRNLQENAIPESFPAVTAATYREFLVERRKLMADAIRSYYEQL